MRLPLLPTDLRKLVFTLLNHIVDVVLHLRLVLRRLKNLKRWGLKQSGLVMKRTQNLLGLQNGWGLPILWSMSFCIFHAGGNGEIQLQRSIVEISKFLIMYDGKTVSCLRIS